MIKLINIISEIKITGNILNLTLDKFRKLFNYWTDDNFDYSSFDPEFHLLLTKYGIKFNSQSEIGNLDNTIKKFDKIKLQKFYNDLIDIEQKFNLENLTEIKVSSVPPARGIKELKLILPKIIKYFPDAKIGYVEHPIGLIAYIYFTSKNKKSERYGDKWQISYFDFFPVPPKFEKGRYILDVDERQKNPDYYPDYTDNFPQNENPNLFLQELSKFFRKEYNQNIDEIKVTSQGDKLVIATKVSENSTINSYNLYFPKLQLKLEKAGVQYKNTNNPTALYIDIQYSTKNEIIVNKIKKLFLSKNYDVETDVLDSVIGWEFKIPEKFIIYQNE